MPLPILGLEDHEAIRKAIRLDVDAIALPSDIIALAVYESAAEDVILARDPLAGGYAETGADAAKWKRVRRAMILTVASAIASAMPPLQEEDFRNYRVRYAPWDSATRAAELRAAADAELAAYLEAEGVSSPLFAF